MQPSVARPLRPFAAIGLALLVGVATLLVAPDRAARAGGFTNLDFGIRRMGMFAVTAKPDDGTAIFHNPAGMTLLEGTQFYSHLSVFRSGLGLKLYDSQGVLRPDDEIEPDFNVGFIPFIGITTDFGVKPLRVGLGVYAPNAYGAALPDNQPTRYHVTRALFVAGRVTAAGAWQITEKFSVGASVSLVPVYLMANRVMNPLVLADPDTRFLPVEETAGADAKLEIDGFDFTWAWDLGVIFRPIDSLRIGVSFQSGSPVRLEGDVVLKQADGTKVSTRHTTWLTIPLTLRAGFNWEFVKDFEIGADIYWWRYSVFQEQRTVLNEPVMGIGAFIDPKAYDDSWNWCVGLLYRVIPELEVMIGYQEDYTPIPNRTFTLENPSRDQRGISLGIRWQVTEKVRIGAAYVRNWFTNPDVQDSISIPPSNGKGHGANDEWGIDVLWEI